MENRKTSLLKKNKKGKELKFEKFPGDKKNLSIVLLKKLEKHQRVLYIIFIVLLILTLTIGSCLLNEYYANIQAKDYVLVNKSKKVFIKITPSDRKSFFKKIGFSSYLNEVVKKDGKNQMTSYAYKNKYEEDNNYDSIRVYYDDSNYVNSISLELFYKKNEFDIDKVYKDCNNIMNNFTNVNINKEKLIAVQNMLGTIDEAVENGIKISYKTKLIENKTYYLVSITVEK